MKQSTGSKTKRSMSGLRLNPNIPSMPLCMAGKTAEEVQEEYGLIEVARLGSNENPLGPSPLALAAFRDALKDAHRYPGMADKRLRQKLSLHFNSRYGSSFNEENFMTGNGLGDVLRIIAQAFIFEGDESVISTPTFPMYRILTEQFGGRCRLVSHKDYHCDLLGIADAVTPETRLLFVCNPNNPTGTHVTRNQIRALMTALPPSVVVVFDEAYHEFAEDPTCSSALEYVKMGWRNVVVLRTFSKIYGMANLRLGYALAAKDLIGYLLRARIAFNTGDPVLYAAMAALDDHGHLQRVRELISTEKHFLYDGFADLGLRYVPTEANFILLTDLPNETEVISAGLLRRGVVVCPADQFGMRNAIRVTIGRHDDNEKLLTALREVMRLCDNPPSPLLDSGRELDSRSYLTRCRNRDEPMGGIR